MGAASRDPGGLLELQVAPRGADPEHECGLYALRSRKRIEELVADWVGSQGNPDAWAIGRVSLWGRVAEWELGWRGEYAYPYALTVHSDDERAGQAIRDLYLVDVEHAPAFEPNEDDNDDDDEDPVAKVAALLSELGGIKADLNALQTRTPCKHDRHGKRR
jgi:hypothetical protein